MLYSEKLNQRFRNSPYLFKKLQAFHFLISLIFLIPVLGFSQEDAQNQETAEDRIANLSIELVLKDFDLVEKSITEEYVDPGFGGTDWEKLKKEYKQKIESAQDPKRAYELLIEMACKLGNENTTIFPPWLTQPAEPEFPEEVTAEEALPAEPPEEEKATAEEPSEQDAVDALKLKYTGVGVLIQQVESGEIMVVQVFEGGPAEKAGVLIGDVIVGVDGWEVSRETKIEEVTERSRGPEGTEVLLTLRDPLGEERKVAITRASIELKPEVKHRIIEGTIGYLRIPLLTPELASEGARALPQLLNTRRMILDLRSVESGSIEGMVRIAQWFLGAANMGGFQYRKGAFALPYNKEAIAAYHRPLVILTNSRTYGLAEVLVFLMQEYRRATIIGNNTAGRFELMQLIELPSGGVLRLSVARYISPRGNPLPFKGIAPEVIVEPPDISLLREGRDTYVEKAVEELRRQ